MTETVQQAATTPAGNEPAREERLTRLEGEMQALKNKGIVIAVISALLGSGGGTAVATAYLSGSYARRAGAAREDSRAAGE